MSFHQISHLKFGEFENNFYMLGRHLANASIENHGIQTEYSRNKIRDRNWLSKKFARKKQLAARVGCSLSWDSWPRRSLIQRSPHAAVSAWPCEQGPTHGRLACPRRSSPAPDQLGNLHILSLWRCLVGHEPLLTLGIMVGLPAGPRPQPRLPLLQGCFYTKFFSLTHPKAPSIRPKNSPINQQKQTVYSFSSLWERKKNSSKTFHSFPLGIFFYSLECLGFELQKQISF